MVVPISQPSFLKLIVALVFSIGSSLTMHCLLLLSLSLAYFLQLLSSFSISALVTSAAFVAAGFIEISLVTLQQNFKIFPHSYECKLARCFHAALHEVPGVTAVPSNTATNNSTYCNVK